MPHTLLSNNSYLYILPKIIIAGNYFCNEADCFTSRLNCAASTFLTFPKKTPPKTKQKTLSCEVLGLLHNTLCLPSFLSLY